jgi:hypothetical protein
MMSGFSTDYNQVLLVCVHGARNLRKADVIGSSDAYAVIKFPVEGAAIFSATETDKWKTNVVKSSLNPTWNRSVTITTRRNVDFFPVEIFDEDVGSVDDSLGKCSITIRKDQPFTLHDEWHVVNAKHNSEVHVSYIFVPLDAVTGLASANLAIQQQLQAAMTDDQADDAKIATLTAQVQSLVGEKASLSSYAGTLQQQIGAMESETEHLKLRIAELERDLATKSHKPQTMTVLHATYGGHDVVNTVRAMVAGGNCTIPASNGVFGDPTPGQYKQLHIKWAKAEGEVTVEEVQVGEGGEINIA